MFTKYNKGGFFSITKQDGSHLQIRWFLNKAKQFTGSCGFRRGTLIKGSNYLEEFIINNNTFLSPSLYLSFSLFLYLSLSENIPNKPLHQLRFVWA